MMEQYLLSVDVGGTYIKSALFKVNGDLVNNARRYNQCISPRPNWIEYDQDTLWQTSCQCIREIIEKTGIDPKQIVCVGVTGQGCGFYAVDENGGNIRNAIASSDERASVKADEWLRNGTSERLYKRIYRYAAAGHLSTILAWLKENEPAHYYRIHRLFAMKDLLVYRLTGNAIASYGCQSASCLMDLRTQTFDPDIAAAYGIDEMADKFGPLKWDIEIAGAITREASEQSGLLADTPVSAGLHDVVASALAMGIVDSELCFMILGTHGINGYISPAPVLNGSIRSNELFAFPGMFLIEEGYPSSSATLEWVIRVLFDHTDQEVDTLYASIDEMIAAVSPEEHCPVFLPFLRGQRDNPLARSAWIGLCPEHTRAHMLRAVYEGVAFTHRMQSEYLFLNRKRPEKIRIAGGATNSMAWMQIFADVLGIPVETVPSEEMGVKGVAIASSVAIGLYPDVQSAVSAMSRQGATIYPQAEYAGIYTRRYESFKSVVAALDPQWTELAN